MIPKNKHNVYCFEEMNFIHYSEFTLEMHDNYTGGTSNEAMNSIEKSLKEVIKQAQKRLKIIQDARSEKNQKSLFNNID